jgi:hypothetical protein
MANIKNCNFDYQIFNIAINYKKSKDGHIQI